MHISNLFLVGPMGVGKSTIGRQLAQHLDLTFKDSDREIEEHTGASISLIFELEGEAGFRKRERTMISKLTAENRLVLSTGGGVILDAENRTHLKSRGYVIYLHAELEELLSRLAPHRGTRPLLETENPKERLAGILEEREPLYREVADVVVETGGRSIQQVVQKVLKHLKSS